MFRILSFLTKIPFLGTAVKWVGGNLRLVIEYALVGVLLVVAGHALTMWFRTQALEVKAEALAEKVNEVEFVNSMQSQTIDWYAGARERDARALRDVVSNFNTAAQDRTAKRDRLKLLEKNDALVNDLLTQPVPPSLNCMYQPVHCKTDAAGNPISPASAAK